MVRILVVVVLAFLVGAGGYAETPDQSTILQLEEPNVKGYRCAVSEDERVTVCWDERSTSGSTPPVERYSKLYDHMEQHFDSVERGEAKVHIYIHTYKRFVKRLGKIWPEGTSQIKLGFATFRAVTYGAKGAKIMVIEAYQPPDDAVIIHELMHHYMNSLVRDGSLNNHLLIEPYTNHVETLFRTTLEKEY